jgi:hypothetical protein
MKELIAIHEQTNLTIFAHLKEQYFGDYQTDGENFFYKHNPKSPFLLVAHMDTVVRDVKEVVPDTVVKPRTYPDRIVNGRTVKGYTAAGYTTKGYTREAELVEVAVSRNVMFNKNKAPLGADDRAGIFGIIEILRTCKTEGLPEPSVLITNYEEGGGVGVKAFLKTDLFETEGLRLMIELDRKGCNEYVDYLDVPAKVDDYVESFGFQKKYGSYSDIADLTDMHLIPGVNLSIGYYDQHTANEVLHIDEMYMTIDRVLSMIDDPIEELYECEPYAYTYKGKGSGTSKHDKKHMGYSEYDYGAYDYKNEKFKYDGLDGDDEDYSVVQTFVPDATAMDKVHGLLDIFIHQKCTPLRQCKDCGHQWYRCDCGKVIGDMIECFDHSELKDIQDMCLFEDEPMWVALQDFCFATDDVAKAN